MNKRDFLSIADFPEDEIRQVVDRAIDLKKSNQTKSLAGQNIALLFEKPSLRTKASFDVGIHQMGGWPVYFGPDEIGLGVREPVSDVARVLDGYFDGIVARVNNHSTLVELAEYAKSPVINALSNWEHPCQTLADLQTIKEATGQLDGLTIAYIGDGNNVARSLALGIAMVGSNFSIASPEGYQLDSPTIELALTKAAARGTKIRMHHNIREAVKGANVVYTDVWMSMGQEAERVKRRRAFKGYTVDPELMSHALPNAIFMHDMPAHYGEEVAHGMLDHPTSVAFIQAENRLHAQKALLELLIEFRPPR